MIINSKNVAEGITAVYRPFKQAAVPLMLAARSAGHYRVAEGWRDTEIRKSFVELFWGVSGSGCFIVDGREHLLEPGQVCFYLPGDVHRIRHAGNGVWEYWWLTFDGPGAADLIARMELGREPFNAGPCPTADFTHLIAALRDFSPSGQYHAGATAYNILSTALGCRYSGSGFGPTEKFKQMVMKNYHDPEWDVNRAAAELRMHRSTLCRKLKEECGLSPGEYLHSCRVQEALSLLKGTDLRIGEIAARIGLPDQNYFAKVIRRATGMTPQEFRKS